MGQESRVGKPGQQEGSALNRTTRHAHAHEESHGENIIIIGSGTERAPANKDTLGVIDGEDGGSRTRYRQDCKYSKIHWVFNFFFFSKDHPEIDNQMLAPINANHSVKVNEASFD